MLRCFSKLFIKNFHAKVLFLLLLFSFGKSFGQTTIFSENMGNPAVTTVITSNIFQNAAPIVFTGSGDVRITTTSSGYSGSSAGGNVFLTTGGTKDFQIAGIDNSACSSSTLTFGVYKSTTTSNGSELAITVSTDGVTYTPLTMPALPTGAGTAVWSLVTITSGIPSAANLRIRFLNTSAATTQFRIDDVILKGNCSSCTSPSITSQPTSITTNSTSTVTYTVAATGTSLTYQWQVNSGSGFSNVTNTGVYSGATTASLTLTNPTTGMNTYSYQCVVTNTCPGTATTSIATLSVTSGCTVPSITSQPTSITTNTSATVSYTVGATGTSLNYQWQVNTGSGYSNVTNTGVYSGATTASLTLTNPTASMNTYSYQCIVTNACPGTATSSAATLSITACGASVNATAGFISQLGCNAFKLSWTNGNGTTRLVVVSTSPVTGSPTNGTNYTANSTYASGSTIAANQYVVYNGSGNSVFIMGLSASTTYYYKVFEYSTCSGSATYLTTGVLSGSGTTSSCSSPAGATAVYVDACGGSCGFEGSNELVWGTSGSYALAVSTNGPTIHYNSTTPPTTTQISTYAQYAANITALNAAVTSCTNTVFVDPNTQGYIPPNSHFLIAHSCMCTPAAYDFSGLCNSGPVYVVFGNNAAWPCGNASGIFGNQSACNASPRYFDLDFTAWGISLDPIYNYNPCSLTNGGDGDIILLNPAGGIATTYSNSGCLIPLIILPIELEDFYTTKNGNKNDIVWKVSEEKNISSYTIEKSENGIDFSALGKTPVDTDNKEYSGVKTYSLSDEEPYGDITYYRLATQGKNGTQYYKTISVDGKSSNWESLHYQQNQQLVIAFKNNVPKNSSVSLFDLSGKLLLEQDVTDSQTIINTQNYDEGLYFVKIQSPYKTENFKIVIQK